MADYTFASELFFDELLRISSNIIWKNPVKAINGESFENVAYVEQYILSRQGRLSFVLIEQFSEDVLLSLGLDNDLVASCMDNRSNIPVALRDLAVQRQMEYNINNYVERNNYYRMLNGLPNLEDTEDDWFYNTMYPDISGSDIPIHLLDSSQLYALEGKGFIDNLISMNPKKEYLKHLTSKKIDIYTARQSEDYALLWITTSNYTTLLQEFIDTYDQCRYMIRNVFYQKIMTNNNEEYVGFIGLMILFQTILQMHRKFLDTDITRDFYDEDSLRQVYDSYDVPFFTSIPIEYHKRIVKNINILLSHKGSTRVFYDLFDVFGLDNMAVFEFYMMKIHKFKDGKPAFYYNEDGSLNKREMYDIKFGKVQLYNDPTTEMQEPRNQIVYEDLIRNDPYWINDKDLLDKIYEEDFNYMESKYLGIQTTFNLMKIIYETCYYLKMILDNRELLSYTTVYNSSIHAETNLFDLVVYTCALIMKKYGFEGNIPTDIHSIGSVMGFDFQQDLTVLKENITSNDYLKNDTTLLKYLETMDVSSLESVKKVYSNLSELRMYIVRKMSYTDDISTYWAYYELYQLIMYSEYTKETFKKSNGKTADSFNDLLEDIAPDLYIKLGALSDTDIDSEISDSLYLLKSSCTTLSHIQYADSITIDTLIEYLLKLLEFFKSAKADLTGYEIVFSLISSAENIMKLMNVITYIYDDYSSDPQYSIIDELSDLIWLIRDRTDLLDKYKLIAEMNRAWDSTLVWDIIDYLEDQISMLSEVVTTLYSSQMYIEDISSEEIILLEDDSITHKDQLHLLWDKIAEILRFFIDDRHVLFDELIKITEVIGKDLTKDEKYTLMAKISLTEYMKFKDEYTINDRVMTIEELYKLESALPIFKSILKSIEDRYSISSDKEMLDLVNTIEESFGKTSDINQFFEDIKEEEIILLNKLSEKDNITIVSNIIEKMFRYFMEDSITFDDTIKLFDSMKLPKKSEYNLYSALLPSRESFTHQDSKLVMSDQLILRKQEIFED